MLSCTLSSDVIVNDRDRDGGNESVDDAIVVMLLKRMMTIMTKTMLMTGISGWVPLDQDI